MYFLTKKIFFLECALLAHLLFYVRYRLYFLFYLWQIKEFRIDRLKSEAKQNKTIIFPKINIVFSLPLFILSFLAFFEKISPLIFLAYILVFLAYALKRTSKYKTLLKKTKKVKALFYFTFLIVVLVYLGGILMSQKTIYLFDFLFFFLVFLAILPAKFLNFILKQKAFWKAKKKRQLFKDLTVIGITGSYGKTTTKEFLAFLLEKKFGKEKVLKSEKNQNTEIAIANLVLNKLNKSHKFLIAEVGAYKIGEIKKVMGFLKPQFGILTGISFQHLDLFGSFENIKKAKSEIVYNLPKNNSLAVFNGSNSQVLEIAKKYPNKKIIYSFKKAELSDFWAENISQTKDYLEFDIATKTEKQKIKLNLIGKHYIENFLGAASLANFLGIPLKEISRYASQITPPPTSLKKTVLANGLTIVNDTYNMNFEGIISALEYLGLYQGKKIILLPCLIETGKKSKELHQKIAQKINNICFRAYVFGKDCLKYFKNYNPDKFISNPTLEDIKNLKQSFGKEDVILLEGRLNKKIIDIFQ